MLKLFSSLTPFGKITSGAILALTVALGIVIWRADTISDQRDAALRQVVVEQAQHAVTKASLASLTARMETMVKEGELRRERLDRALEQTERVTAPLRKQADALESGEIDIITVEGL